MLGEHVAVFNFKGFADSVGHEEGMESRPRKASFQARDWEFQKSNSQMGHFCLPPSVGFRARYLLHAAAKSMEKL
jgi:hypothetical protein